MRGRILGCHGSECAINTDGGERFKFALSEWKGGARAPQPQDEVDFVGANGVATEVYLLNTGATSASPDRGVGQAPSAAYGMSAPQQAWAAGAAAHNAAQRPKAKLWRGNIRGRLSRKDFWRFWLILFLCQMVILIVVAAGSYSVPASGSDADNGAEILRLIGLIARPFQLIITGLSLNITVRRLHDSGHTGWWVLLFAAWTGLSIVVGMLSDKASNGVEILLTGAFLVGGFVQLWPLYWIFIQRGDEGPNKFGPDPLMPIPAI